MVLRNKAFSYIASGLAFITILGIAAASAVNNSNVLAGGIRKANAAQFVNTAHCLALDETWGYAGELSKDKMSDDNNNFTISFSDSFGNAGGGNAFSTTMDGQYVYISSELNGVSQIYVKGSSTNAKTGITVYGHFYNQTECLDDSETIESSLNTLINIEPTKYVAIEFEGIDNIESIEIGYSCEEPTDPFDHLKYGGAHADGNGYHQSYMGFSTDFPVGTHVLVEMDVSVSGSFDAASSIGWVDSVWSDDSRNVATSIRSLVTSEAGWHHISFEANVRNFPLLRWNAKYSKVDTSEYGNAVYVLTENTSVNAFNFKNVSISLDYYVMTPSGNNNNSQDMYYQSLSLGGLSTDYPVGTSVIVDMDVQVTGTFNSYSHTYAAETVYSVAGGELYGNISLDSYIDYTDKTNWQHISFAATVRNFPALRGNSAYPVVDTSSVGNGVYLIAINKSADSFNYKNVSMIEKHSMVDGGSKSNGYHQTFAGLSTDLPVGSTVLVEMDVLRTGSFDQYSSVGWVNSIQATEGDAAYVANRTSLRPEFGIEGSVAWTSTDWQHVSFEAKVGNYPQLRKDIQYSVYDTSSFGNAVYLITENKDNKSFDYKNVSFTYLAPTSQKNSNNNYYTSYLGLPVSGMSEGTSVHVAVDLKITGGTDSFSCVYALDRSVIKWGSGNYANGLNSVTIASSSSLPTSDFVRFEFNSKVYTHSSALHWGDNGATFDTSIYGPCVLLAFMNTTNAASPGMVKNIVITAI